jgi:hypothetical protein
VNHIEMGLPLRSIDLFDYLIKVTIYLLLLFYFVTFEIR